MISVSSAGINQGVWMTKTQRIRDVVHNLIEFDGGKFEQTCWGLLDTRPMQRLRRIKQLGFSEFVYPGACHTRFAHSVYIQSSIFVYKCILSQDH